MYNLNINKSSIVPTNLIVGRVLDKPFDTIQFKIHDGLDVMDLTGCTLEFRGTTPDNKKVTSNAIKILDTKSGEIEFTFPPNFYSAKGHFQNAYFVIKKGGYVESTNDLLINVLNAVDFNVDDAPIIIDQLDDLIQAVIDDINKQLSTVKLDIKQTQNNIDTLKKDVDAYKKEFATEIARMQKQLDDLAKAINQTDIQRPQITRQDGSVIYTFSNINEIFTKPKGVITFDMAGGSVGNPSKSVIHGIAHTVWKYQDKASGWVICSDRLGNIYHRSYESSVLVGEWTQLNGQVPKITHDDGKPMWVANSNDKKLEDELSILKNGLHYVHIDNSINQPEKYIKGMLTISGNGEEMSFIGTAILTGNSYSWKYSQNKSEWSRLDGQVQKITQDDGSAFVDKLQPIGDYLKSLPVGITSRKIIYTTNEEFVNNGFPSQLGHAYMTVNKSDVANGFVTLAGSFGDGYMGVYNAYSWNGWKKIT